MSHPKPDHERTTRLAEGDFAVVDLCNCGTLQLHLGDLTLRLSPEVVQGLTRTLAAALSRRQALLDERATGDVLATSWSVSENRRGKA